MKRCMDEGFVSFIYCVFNGQNDIHRNWENCYMQDFSLKTKQNETVLLCKFLNIKLKAMKIRKTSENITPRKKNQMTFSIQI